MSDGVRNDYFVQFRRFTSLYAMRRNKYEKNVYSRIRSCKQYEQTKNSISAASIYIITSTRYALKIVNIKFFQFRDTETFFSA